MSTSGVVGVGWYPELAVVAAELWLLWRRR